MKQTITLLVENSEKDITATADFDNFMVELLIPDSKSWNADLITTNIALEGFENVKNLRRLAKTLNALCDEYENL